MHGGSLLSAAHRRNSGGFSPLSVSNCTLWLDASAITGLSDGDACPTWADLSGLGNDATASGSDRAIYKTNRSNGLPALYFDGAKKMTVASTVNLAALLIVAKYASTSFGGFDGLISGPAGTNDDIIFVGFLGQSYWYQAGPSTNYRKNGVSMALNASGAAPMNAYAVLYVEGAHATSLVIGNDRNVNTSWNGDIVEIIGYSSVPSAGDSEALEDYLGDKNGIAITH